MFKPKGKVISTMIKTMKSISDPKKSKPKYYADSKKRKAAAYLALKSSMVL